MAHVVETQHSSCLPTELNGSSQTHFDQKNVVQGAAQPLNHIPIDYTPRS